MQKAGTAILSERVNAEERRHRHSESLVSEYLGAVEIMVRYSVSESQARRWMACVPRLQMGRKLVRVKAADLEAYLSKHTVQPVAALLR
ncbi:MAG TPA: hypothetical protein VGO93_28755 [Candidatus Xenobia bacterium]|jgi:hypothetical protein